MELNATPRKTLQALGKERGVHSAQKKEARVDGIVRALSEKATANDESEGTDVATSIESKEAGDAPSEGEKQQSGEVTEEDEEANATAKDEQKNQTPKPKPTKRAPVSSVGKSAVKGKSTPTRKSPAATMPSSAKVSSSSKKFDVLHAKQLAEEPTIYEHDKAKKVKADALLTYSATRATRSSSKKEAVSAKKARDDAAVGAPVAKRIVFKATRNHVSVAEKPTISSSLKRTAPSKAASQEKSASGRNPLQAKKAPFTSTVNAGAKKTLSAKTPAEGKASDDTKPKKTFSYKPYTGPLPKYKEDPLFSPVDKAKVEAAKENAKPKPSTQTPAKKSRESSKPLHPAAKSATTPSGSARTPIKKSSSSSSVAAKAKEDRRSRFAQDAKAKGAAARQSPRSRGVKAE